MLLTSIHDPPSGWIRSLELQKNRSIVDVSHFENIPDSFSNVGLGQRPWYGMYIYSPPSINVTPLSVNPL